MPDPSDWQYIPDDVLKAADAQARAKAWGDSQRATVAAEWGDSHRLAIPPMRDDWATQRAAPPVDGQSAAGDFGPGVSLQPIPNAALGQTPTLTPIPNAVPDAPIT